MAFNPYSVVPMMDGRKTIPGRADGDRASVPANAQAAAAPLPNVSPYGWQPSMRYDLLGFGDAYNTGWIENTADRETGRGDQYTMTPELRSFLAQGGFQPVQYMVNGLTAYGIADGQGNIVPGTEQVMSDDSDFMTAALLASGITGANVLAAQGAMAGAGSVSQGAMAGAAPGGGIGAGAASSGLTAGQTAAAGGAVGGAAQAGSAAGVGAGTAAGGGAAGLSSTQLAALQAGGGLLSSYMQGQSADRAAAAQRDAAVAGQQTQLEMFNRVQQLLQPFVGSGTAALGQLGGLAGLNGADAQRAAIEAIRSGPEFQALQQQGEERILANASATGGLRGGNTQAALAQFSPALLSQLIGQQFDRLGGITSLGQNAAAGVGNAGISTGQGVANLQQQAGAATAGGILAQGRQNAGYVNSILSGIGLWAGMNGW